MKKNNLSWIAIIISVFALVISGLQLYDNKFNWKHEVYVQEECIQWVNLEHVLNDLDGGLANIKESKIDEDVYEFILDEYVKNLGEYDKVYISVAKYSKKYAINQDLMSMAIIHDAIQEKIEKNPYKIILVNGEIVRKYKIEDRQQFIKEINDLLKNSYYQKYVEHVYMVLDKELTQHQL